MVKLVPDEGDKLPCGRVIKESYVNDSHVEVIVCLCEDGSIVKFFNDPERYECEKNCLERLKGCEGTPEVLGENSLMGITPYIIFANHGSEIDDEFLEDNYMKVFAIIKRMHERGVIHADIKHENILQTPSGDITIIDFDASMIIGEKCFWDKMGTYPYKAPELLKHCENIIPQVECTGMKGECTLDNICNAPLTPYIDHFMFGIMMCDTFNNKAFERVFNIDYDKRKSKVLSKKLYKLPIFIEQNIDKKHRAFLKKMCQLNPAKRVWH